MTSSLVKIDKYISFLVNIATELTSFILSLTAKGKRHNLLIISLGSVDNSTILVK